MAPGSWTWLAFKDPRQEARWQLKFAADQARLDTAFSLQTLLFPGLVARTLWMHLNSGTVFSTWEVLWLACFLAWAPLFLVLGQLRPDAFHRLRTPLVLLSRVQRQMTIMHFAPLFHAEAAGGSIALQSSSVASKLGILIWRQPGTLATLLNSYILPLRYNAPCAAFLLMTSLGSTLRHCTAECHSEAHVGVEGFYRGLARHAQHMQLPWLQRPGVEVEGPAGSAAGSCSADGCRHSCLALHAWLQIILGTLLPLLVSWVLEESSRYRFQRQWLQFHIPSEAVSSEADGGTSERQPVVAPPPVPTTAVVLWFLVCAWVVWVLLEILLL